MKTILHALAIFVIFQACVGQDYLSDDKHLIGSYYFFEAGPQSCIIYNGKETYRGTGAEVVPGKVIETSIRSHYLIATSQNVISETKSYWVIDTNKDIRKYYLESMPRAYYDSVLTSNVFGPLDIDQYLVLLDTLR